MAQGKLYPDRVDGGGGGGQVKLADFIGRKYTRHVDGLVWVTAVILWPHKLFVCIQYTVRPR